MDSSILERFIETMDERSLRHYLKEHRKRLMVNERNYRNSLMVVEELEREAEKRGLQ